MGQGPKFIGLALPRQRRWPRKFALEYFDNLYYIPGSEIWGPLYDKENPYMAVEDIERTLQTVTEKQNQFAEAQKANEVQLAELREIVKQIAVAHESIVELISLHEKRLDGQDVATQAANDKLNALIDAQVGLEDRQAKLDEVVKRVAMAHESIVELISLHEKRFDGQDVATQAANDKLNALINAQAGLEDRQAKLDEVVKRVAVAHESIVELISLHEKRLDGHDSTEQATDDKLNALIDAQVGFEDHQAKLEESYQLLVQLARTQEGRIDRQDVAAQATDDKLNALINAQVGFEDRQAKIEEIAMRIAESHGSISDLIRLQEKRLNGHDEAFLHANGRLNALMNPARKATKVAKKKATKKKPRS
jgi:chromosome segregation ATPase